MPDRRAGDPKRKPRTQQSRQSCNKQSVPSLTKQQSIEARRAPRMVSAKYHAEQVNELAKRSTGTSRRRINRRTDERGSGAARLARGSAEGFFLHSGDGTRQTLRNFLRRRSRLFRSGRIKRKLTTRTLIDP